MNKRIFISIGSNLGDRVKNLRDAIEAIKNNNRIFFVNQSSFYETPPWGKKDQPYFINCVIEVEAALTPRELLKFLKTIESDMGRVSGIKWGARIIDLDIIFFGGEVIEEPDLKIPHPLMNVRGFVLIPLCEIAPDFIHPTLKKTVFELAAAIKDKEEIKRIEKSF